MIIDISEMNRIGSWQKIKESVDAVIIRMGYRGYGKTGNIVMDKKYKTYVDACRKNGIKFGLYFFPTAINEKEAKEEANWVIKNLPKDMKFDFPVFADSEYAHPKAGGRSDHLSISERTRFLKVFCDTLQAAGVPAGIYASTAWLQQCLDMKKLPYTVWVAQYAKKCTYKGAYTMWQYSGSATVPGVIGACDVSVLVGTTAKKATTKALYKAKVTASAGLNVRKTPGIAFDNIIGSVTSGTEVEVFAEQGSWAKISATKEEWISRSWLRKIQ